MTNYCGRVRPCGGEGVIVLPTKQRRAIARLVVELNDVTDQLRLALVSHREGVTEFGRLVKEGHSGIDALDGARAAEHREEVSGFIKEFELVRHHLRLAIFALCVEEGDGLSEVGRHFGISRQLASRLAVEAEELGY